MRRLPAILFAMTTGLPAMADVLDSGPGGFTIAHEVTVAVSRGDAWRAAVADVGRWWHPDHTMTGDAGNLSIDAVPLGCFCEALGGDGGAVHLTVTFVNPDVMLKLTGGLGPLGLMGVDGNMTWEFFDADGGTRLKWTYAVGGYRPGGLDAVAAPVDAVIGEALGRLKAYAETGDPDDAG